MTFFAAVHKALIATIPSDKVVLTQALYKTVEAGCLDLSDRQRVVAPERPGLPTGLTLVHPNQLKRRSPHTEKGRAVLIHAIAHIEFNAINLALDAVLRFSHMPDAYLRDWLSVAAVEADHFQLVQGRLQAYGYDYGDFPAHNGLWDVASRSADDVLERMAVVPRVLEARGLDVTPAMRDNLEAAGDSEMAAILDIIYRDEIGHVAVGTQWFRWLCEKRDLDPMQSFQQIIQRYYSGSLRGPFNHEARLKAGFDKVEMDMLAALNSKLTLSVSKQPYRRL